MADKLVAGWFKRPTSYGLIKNGKFRTGVQDWEIRDSDYLTWVNKRLASNHYVAAYLTVDFIPAGTEVVVEWVVDTLGDSAGYSDLYEIDSSNSSNNWQKYYFSDGLEISTGVYQMSRNMTLQKDTYKFNLILIMIRPLKFFGLKRLSYHNFNFPWDIPKENFLCLKYINKE